MTQTLVKNASICEAEKTYKNDVNEEIPLRNIRHVYSDVKELHSKKMSTKVDFELAENQNLAKGLIFGLLNVHDHHTKIEAVVNPKKKGGQAFYF